MKFPVMKFPVVPILRAPQEKRHRRPKLTALVV
jgi:hypothetical protein